MTTSKEKSIKTLLAGCRKGDRHDWTELMSRLSPVIFSACFRFRLSREESYDVFGKVSLLLLGNLDNLRDDDRIFGYVATIAHHEATAIKTRSRLSREKLREMELNSAEIYETCQGSTRLELDEELKIMSRAFTGLSSKCQELLRLLFLASEEISYRDIARELDIPVSSIGPTRGRCLQKLRLNMIEEGYEE